MWFLDHEYLETMYTMYRKVNGNDSLEFDPLARRWLLARERIVGWYHTGPKLQRNDISINELMREYHPDSVLVIIDAKPKDLGLPTEAYIAVEEIRDVSTERERGSLATNDVLSSRMEVQLRKPSNIYHQRSEQKKPKKSVSNISFGKIELKILDQFETCAFSLV